MGGRVSQKMSCSFLQITHFNIRVNLAIEVNKKKVVIIAGSFLKIMITFSDTSINDI